MSSHWKEEDIERLKTMLGNGIGAKEIDDQTGWGLVRIQNKMYRMGLQEQKGTTEQSSGEYIKYNESNKTATLVSVDRNIKTPADALEYAEVDLRIWEIDRFTTNKYEQASKDEEGNINVVELWQVKVWLKRKISLSEQKSLDYLKDAISSAKWKPAKRPDKRPKGDHLLEVSLFDAHFGKLCWAAETGTDYDTIIANKFYLNAVDDLLADNKDAEIEKIIFPVGNDFFNVDNLRGETTSGTPQDVDSRYHKVFEKGFHAVVSAIERCRKVAPVEIILIEGNHDTLSSYHLAHSLKCAYCEFSQVDDVGVDCGPESRKYRKYGITLLGFTHGDGEKPSDRTTLMAREASEWWHGCKFYEWHTGHFHAEKKLQQAGTETNGIVERVLPSLSGTDRWHSKKGFTLNRQAAMAFLYDKEQGMRRTSYAYARDK